MLSFHDLAWVRHTTYICNHNGFSIKNIITPKVFDITDNFDMSLNISISCFLAKVFRAPDKDLKLTLCILQKISSFDWLKAIKHFKTPSLSIRYRKKSHQYDRNHCGKNLPRHTSYLLQVNNLNFIEHVRTFANA